MRVAGEHGRPSFSLQTIKLRLPAETSFTLSGWAKADSVPTAFDEGRTFRLVAQLKYSDGVYEEPGAGLQRGRAEWQYGSAGIVPKRRDRGLDAGAGGDLPGRTTVTRTARTSTTSR